MELVRECERVVREECFLQICVLVIGTVVEALGLAHAKSWVGCVLSWQESWEHWNLVNCSEKSFHQLKTSEKENIKKNQERKDF